MSAVRMRRTLDVKGADAVMAAAENEAVRNGYRVVIAVVDAWGHLLHLRRTEDAQAASGQVAIDKARTAAIFVRPSREIEQPCTAARARTSKTRPPTGAPRPCTWPRRYRCRAESRSSTGVT